MKKLILQRVCMALIAFAPASVLFAGEGDGKDNKTVIEINATTSSPTISFIIQTSSKPDISNIQFHAKSGASLVTAVSSLSEGILVTLEVSQETGIAGAVGEPIIYEVVGVDNITGIVPADNNLPTYAEFSFNTLQTEGTANPTETSSNNSSFTSPANSGPQITPVGNVSSSDVTIYPNPVMAETNVVTVGEILGKTINIMDLTGKVVFTKVMGAEGRAMVINLSDLKPGIYIVNIELEGGKVISKKIQKI